MNLPMQGLPGSSAPSDYTHPGEDFLCEVCGRHPIDEDLGVVRVASKTCKHVLCGHCGPVLLKAHGFHCPIAKCVHVGTFDIINVDSDTLECDVEFGEVHRPSDTLTPLRPPTSLECHACPRVVGMGNGAQCQVCRKMFHVLGSDATRLCCPPSICKPTSDEIRALNATGEWFTCWKCSIGGHFLPKPVALTPKAPTTSPFLGRRGIDPSYRRHPFVGTSSTVAAGVDKMQCDSCKRQNTLVTSATCPHPGCMWGGCSAHLVPCSFPACSRGVCPKCASDPRHGGVCGRCFVTTSVPLTADEDDVDDGAEADDEEEFDWGAADTDEEREARADRKRASGRVVCRHCSGTTSRPCVKCRVPVCASTSRKAGPCGVRCADCDGWMCDDHTRTCGACEKQVCPECYDPTGTAGHKQMACILGAAERIAMKNTGAIELKCGSCHTKRIKDSSQFRVCALNSLRHNRVCDRCFAPSPCLVCGAAICLACIIFTGNEDICCRNPTCIRTYSNQTK